MQKRTHATCLSRVSRVRLGTRRSGRNLMRCIASTGLVIVTLAAQAAAQRLHCKFDVDLRQSVYERPAPGIRVSSPLSDTPPIDDMLLSNDLQHETAAYNWEQRDLQRGQGTPSEPRTARPSTCGRHYLVWLLHSCATVR